LLEQIEREIDQIKQTIADYEQKITIAYDHYRGTIATSVGKQLIQATFSLCTRAYPAKFLGLSVGQRQELQKDFQKLAKSTHSQVTEELAQLSCADLLTPEALDRLLEKLLANISQTANQLLQDYGIIPPAQEGESPPLIKLRPAEVEFTDRQVMGYRSEIRVFSARCQHLHQELAKKYHAHQVAQAELSWRSLWIDY
jgi:hypothetical protein